MIATDGYGYGSKRLVFGMLLSSTGMYVKVGGVGGIG